jgi:TRAP-type C4-dicarboxylate transport system substrate-binding protein
MVPAAAVASGIVGLDGEAFADGETVLKFATLAPQASLWGKVFGGWQSLFNQKAEAGGLKLRLKFFYNAQQGDEAEMVGKIKKGQIDGAAITAVGLGEIYKQVLALQLPIFKSWAQLDAARDALKPVFDAEFEKAGFRALGWGDVGEAHLWAKRDEEIRRPKDLQKRNVFYLKGDPIGPMFYTVIGGVTPKSLSVPEIDSALNSNSIDVINTPALALSQLNWAKYVRVVNRMVSGYGIGALVMSSAKYNALSDAEKALLKETGGNAASTLTKVIREADRNEFERLIREEKKVAYMPNAEETAQWDAVFKQVREKLTGSTFNPDIVAKVVAAAQGK